MIKKLLCTIGPSSLRPGVLERLEEFGVSLFRINLSHTTIDDLPDLIRQMQRRSNVPICLDSEGAQVRTGDLAEPVVELAENAVVFVGPGDRPGNAEEFGLYPPDVVDRLEVGDFVSIDFDTVLVQVTGRAPGRAQLRVVTGGRMGRNKAVTIKRELTLPALTDKDRQALEIGARMGVRHVALSFAHRPEDVDEIRAAFGAPVFVISKIECRAGLRHLDAIIDRSDAILIDRGDLSREVPIERLPSAQKTITGRAKARGREVYVATNLLETMIGAPHPTRAEVNDVFNTLADGADGLVLAAETAIGKYPLQCASMINKLVHEFEKQVTLPDLEAYVDDPFSMLVEPHGGRLVHRKLPDDMIEEVDRLPRIGADLRELLDAQQIALGTYSPITGFMGRDALEGVLSHNRLPDGTVWTMPIVLQVRPGGSVTPAPGMHVVLTTDDGTPHMLLEVSEVYEVDLDDVARRWFGTTDHAHPGVRRLHDRGERFVAGAVRLVRRLPLPYRSYNLSPMETRFVFAHKGWSKVLGFHTRNVCHRVHEHLQLEGLSRTNADGLYISPVTGPKKTGDFSPEAILRSYEIMLARGDVYSPGSVVLGSFASFPRYAGPREAVFTALCRKNMGCSHFIIGRDHTGVGGFYPSDGAQRMFDELGDFGVTPVFFEAIGYNPDSRAYEPAKSGRTIEPISGTQLRDALRAGEELPEWFVRRPVQEMLREEIAAGRPVFVP